MNLKNKIVSIPFVLDIARSLLKLKNHNSRVGNLVMFHNGRCGSTVLARQLEQNKKILWGHEIFQNIPHVMHLINHRKTKLQNIESLLQVRMYRKSCSYYGFDMKGMPEHDLSKDCLDMDLPVLLDLLHKNDYTHHIILKRQNYLRRVVSILVSRKKGEWHTSTEISKPTKIIVDTSNLVVIKDYCISLLKHFEEVDDYYSRLENLLINRKTLNLIYENDIMDDPKVAYQKVCNFLEIEYQEPNISMKRTNPFSLEDMVENLDEVRRCLAGTKYHWMLEE